MFKWLPVFLLLAGCTQEQLSCIEPDSVILSRDRTIACTNALQYALKLDDSSEALKRHRQQVLDWMVANRCGLPET